MLSPKDIEPSIKGSSSYTLKIFNKKENLAEGESFSLIIYIDRNLIKSNDIKITKIEEKEEVKPSDEGNKDDDGLEGWAIALIVVGSVIVVIIIVFLIWKFVISKDRVDSEQIGSLVDHKSPSGQNEMGDTVE